MQLKHMRDRRDKHYIYIVKPRQFGFTTYYCIDMLDDALWVPGMSCAIIAHEWDALDRIFGIVKRAYDNIPPEFKPKARTDTVREYQFTNMYNGAILDSSIYVALKVRSGTVLRLHVSEAAYITGERRQELDAGSKQAVPKDGYITEETTGNGFNESYDNFMESRAVPPDKRTKYDYEPLFYSWVENPEYTLPGVIEDGYTPSEIDIKRIALEQFNIVVTDGQLLWRRWKMKQLVRRNQEGTVGLSGDQLFKQEYPLTVIEAFQSGAGSVFDLERLEQSKSRPHLTLDEIYQQIDARGWPDEYKVEYKTKFKDFTDRGFAFWELPQDAEEYVMGADPADGEGSDNLAISVWHKKTFRKIGEYYGKVRPDDGAQIAADVGYVYNTAFIGIESNMLTMVLYLVKTLEYPRYYSRVTFDEKLQKKTRKIGWLTSGKTRDPMIDAFLRLWEEGEVEIPSAITFKEMRTFVKIPRPTGGYKREHASGKHDDMLFADFIAVQMCLYNIPVGRAFAENPLTG